MSSVENAERRLAQLLKAEIANTCGEESRQNYFQTHQKRFADILQLCQRFVPNSAARVLDIGRSELTAYLANFYHDIHTLGLDPSIGDGGHREIHAMDKVSHITFDLSNSPTVSSWPECGHFDLVIFSEVIEHLCIAPEFVFAALGSMLTEQGVLISSTPNAADIAKRLRLAFGINPYERLRLYSINPGHVREYTRHELREIAGSVGLRCTSHSYCNWIQNRGGNRIKAIIMKFLRLYTPFRSFQVFTFVRDKVVPVS